MIMYRGNFRCEKPFYVFLKKHYCPDCGVKLKRKIRSEMKYPKSIGQSVHSVDDVMGMGNVFGSVHCSYIEFYCVECNKYYKVKEAKKCGI